MNPPVPIVAPLEQRMVHVANHLAIEAMQWSRAVEAKAAGEAFFLGQHILLR